MLHSNLLLPCPYLFEESEVRGPNLKEKGSGNKAKQTVRRNCKIKHDTYLTDIDSSSEEEYHMWTAVRQADRPLNAKADEFCPRMETLRDQP